MGDNCDLLVVGAGPAGIAAALQAARDGLSCVILSREPPGGLAMAAGAIGNLPGFAPGASGPELARVFSRQVREAGIPLVSGVIEAAATDRGTFRVWGRYGSWSGCCLLLATGTEPRPPGVDLPVAVSPLIHRDIRSLPPDLSHLQVAVVGGGEAALDTALSMRARGAEVTLWVRSGQIKAPPGLTDQTRQAGVAIMCGHRLAQVAAVDDGLALTFHTGSAQQDITVFCHHLALCIGRRPRRELYDLLTGPDAALPDDLPGPLPGLFLAGDLIRPHSRFIATAMGDGQRAARLALAHLSSQRSRP